MPRNLDMAALRAFVAVADTGGVTRAAGFLNLTQSAVSMQIKRLELALDQQLLDRSGRGVSLTGPGEQLLSYARRMLALNDEALGRLTDQAYEGEVVLGVPSDIVHPLLPHVLKRFAAEFPRMRVHLVSSYTRRLKALHARGEADLILTTEDAVETGGETLTELPLVWVGAPQGQIWRLRPLRLAFERACIFRAGVEQALDRAGIPWEMAVEADSTRSIEASVVADLAVHAMIATTLPPHLDPVPHGGALPDLGTTRINLYVARPPQSAVVGALANILRQAFAAG